MPTSLLEERQGHLDHIMSGLKELETYLISIGGVAELVKALCLGSLLHVKRFYIRSGKPREFESRLHQPLHSFCDLSF